MKLEPTTWSEYGRAAGRCGSRLGEVFHALVRPHQSEMGKGGSMPDEVYVVPAGARCAVVQMEEWGVGRVPWTRPSGRGAGGKGCSPRVFRVYGRSGSDGHPPTDPVRKGRGAADRYSGTV